jgi:hypothetical protein
MRRLYLGSGRNLNKHFVLAGLGLLYFLDVTQVVWAMFFKASSVKKALMTCNMNIWQRKCRRLVDGFY